MSAGQRLSRGQSATSRRDVEVPRPSDGVAYTATKHAQTGLTRAVALDERAHGIAVGQVDVGNAATDMTAGIVTGAPGGRLGPARTHLRPRTWPPRWCTSRGCRSTS